MRRLSQAHEDARNLCGLCGQFGWRGNPVTRLKTDPEPKHVRCRCRELRGAPRNEEVQMKHVHVSHERSGLRAALTYEQKYPHEVVISTEPDGGGGLWLTVVPRPAGQR